MFYCDELEFTDGELHHTVAERESTQISNKMTVYSFMLALVWTRVLDSSSTNYKLQMKNEKLQVCV